MPTEKEPMELAVSPFDFLPILCVCGGTIRSPGGERVVLPHLAVQHLNSAGKMEAERFLMQLSVVGWLRSN